MGSVSPAVQAGREMCRVANMNMQTQAAICRARSCSTNR